MIKKLSHTEVQTNKNPLRGFSSNGLKLEDTDLYNHDLYNHATWPNHLRRLEASTIPCIGIHEDWQIHTKTGSGPTKLQYRLSGPHTNRTHMTDISIWANTMSKT